MLRLLAIVGMLVIGANAATAGVPSAIKAYNGISIAFSPNAGQCGLADPALYEARLMNRLTGLSVPMDGLAVVNAHLGVSGQDFGPSKDQCVVQVTLYFQLTLVRDQIEIAEVVTRREEIIAVIDKVEKLPLTIYEDGEFGVVSKSAAQDTALNYIDILVHRFAAKR